MYKYRKGSLLIELLCSLIILQGVFGCVSHAQQSLAQWRIEQRQYQQQIGNFIVTQHLQHHLGGGRILDVGERRIKIKHPRGVVYTIEQKKQSLVSVTQNGGHFVLMNQVQQVTFKRLSHACFQMFFIHQKGQRDVQEVHI